MPRHRRTNTSIPGLSFSWRRALGITRARQRFARRTGIPTTRGGMYRKVGRAGCGGWLLSLALAVAILMLTLAYLL